MDGGTDGTHTFCGVKFTNNTSGVGALGGAIGRTPDNAPQTTVIDRCTFDSNHGDDAAAVYFHNSMLQITATTFSNNVATKGCGAMQADGTQLAAAQRHVRGNNAMAGLGGALSLFGGGGSIAFTTFADNHAERRRSVLRRGDRRQPDADADQRSVRTTPRRTPARRCSARSTGTGDGDLQWPSTHAIGGGARREVHADHDVRRPDARHAR